MIISAADDDGNAASVHHDTVKLFVIWLVCSFLGKAAFSLRPLSVLFCLYPRLLPFALFVSFLVCCLCSRTHRLFVRLLVHWPVLRSLATCLCCVAKGVSVGCCCISMLVFLKG